MKIFVVLLSVVMVATLILLWSARNFTTRVEANCQSEIRKLKGDFEYRDSTWRYELQVLRNQDLFVGYKLPHTGITFCEQRVPVESSYVYERLEWQFYFLRQQSGNLIIVWKRMGRYWPIIDSVLDHRGMPRDLLYHFVIESFLNPRAGSDAGASGIEQLMPNVARQRGLLIIDGVIDERRQPQKSAPVACDILKENYEMFNHDWFLAVAAYNLGIYGVDSRLDNRGAKNFFDPPWPAETWHHVYRSIAMSIMYKNRAACLPGLGSVEQYAKVPLVAYKIHLNKITNLGELSELTGVPYGRLVQDYNPQLVGGSLPEGDYTLWFPPEHILPKTQLARK